MTSLASIEHEIANILAVPEEFEDVQPQALEYLDSLAIQEAEKVDAISYPMFITYEKILLYFLMLRC